MIRTSSRLPLVVMLCCAPACGNSKSGATNSGGAASIGGAPGTGGTNAGGAVATSMAGSSASTTMGGGAAVAGSSSGGTSSAGGSTAGGASAGGSANNGGAGGVMSGAGSSSAGGSSTCPSLPTSVIAAKDIVQFNDNGGWCWYQDERALVDTKAGKFIIGSVASDQNSTRDSDQEVVIYDIASGAKKTYTLQSDLNPDDHNAPAFVIRPDGKYVATWATHRDNCNTYYSVFDGTAWSKAAIYDWKNDGCPWEPGSDPPHQITYANPWYLSAENKILSAVRSVSTSPAFLSSTDGSSWKFYGRISSTPLEGYVAGYFKYWGNGTDRIDFVGTEAHPRDKNNNLWHGYYQGEKLYNSKGELVDGTAGDKDAKDIDQFGQVFAQGSTPAGVSGIKLYRLWDHDLVRYADGTIAVTGQGRTTDTAVTDADDPDKRMIYSRWNGTVWKTTYLVKAGPKLYLKEQDYTGLSALHPDNPNVIFVSSTYDPRTDLEVPSKVHELFMGVTCDGGATFKWTPLTENSTEDNIRPIVPKWDSSHTLLLWLRGKYETAQKYKLKVVGTTALQLQ